MNRLLTAFPAAADALDGWIAADERAAADAFGSERRRREYLTWRAVVRRALGPDVRIGYDANGAPQLLDLSLHLSVSHCAGLVAVALSDAPCAVDAESAGRDFSRVCSRYLTPSEASLSSDPLWPAVAWCAKETLYKMLPEQEGTDFARDLFIMLRKTQEGQNLFTLLLQLMNHYCQGVIVEGVETLEEWHDVQNSPAFAAQGYFLSRPVPLRNLEKVMLAL